MKCPGQGDKDKGAELSRVELSIVEKSRLRTQPIFNYEVHDHLITDKILSSYNFQALHRALCRIGKPLRNTDKNIFPNPNSFSPKQYNSIPSLFFFSFLKDFIYLFERESAHEQGVRGRGRGTEGEADSPLSREPGPKRTAIWILLHCAFRTLKSRP